MKDLVFGAEGLKLLQYVGGIIGIIKGPCTDHRYPVQGRKTKPFYADARDAKGLLGARTRNDRRMFKEPL